MKFELDNCEKNRYINFRQRHSGCQYNSAIGGKIGYTFTPTSLGIVVEVTCFHCKESKDITNYKTW